MRIFFAFDLDPSSKAAIADWRDRFALADGRPVAAGNFHITLAFVGELDESRLEPLCDSVDRWQADRQPRSMSITLDQVGYWPSPGIYWAGTSAETAGLAVTARKLGSISQEFGARRERQAWVPHVTLYRGCQTPPPAPISAPRIALPLRNITLFESRRGRRGVTYAAIAQWPL